MTTDSGSGTHVRREFDVAGWPRVWGATDAEVGATYPCDGIFADPTFEAHRAVSIAASRPDVFRWLCQIKAAPYSYDLLNNFGRRSPRTLTPGLEQLQIGQHFIRVFTLVSYVVNEHLTIRVSRLGRWMFGELVISYVTCDEGIGGTRLVVKLSLPRATRLGWFRQWMLAWLDLFMMRKQLLNLRDLAEGKYTASSRVNH